MHVQVIVSRKDAENRMKLSPLSHHRGTKKGPVKGGFDRVNFKLKSMEQFDRMFGYERKVNELERYQVMKYGTKEEKAAYQQKQIQKDKPIAQGVKPKIQQQQPKVKSQNQKV